MGPAAVYLLAATVAIGAVGAGIYGLATADGDRAPIEEIEGRPDEVDDAPQPELEPLPAGDDDERADEGRTGGGENTGEATGGGGDT